jgi:hypothetical protein
LVSRPLSHRARPQGSTTPAVTRQRPQPAATRTGRIFTHLATFPRYEMAQKGVSIAVSATTARLLSRSRTLGIVLGTVVLTTRGTDGGQRPAPFLPAQLAPMAHLPPNGLAISALRLRCDARAAGRQAEAA